MPTINGKCKHYSIQMVEIIDNYTLEANTRVLNDSTWYPDIKFVVWRVLEHRHVVKVDGFDVLGTQLAVGTNQWLVRAVHTNCSIVHCGLYSQIV